MTNVQPLQNGGLVPHFVVQTHDGGRVDYSTIWQRRNLVLVATDSAAEDERYLRELSERTGEFDEHETIVVATHEHIAGLPTPGLIVADRWGEIVHLVTPTAGTELPPPDTLLQWLEAIEHRCPECEGEAR